MTTTFTAWSRVDPAAEEEHKAAYRDARTLALELGHGQPAAPLDPTAHGVVFCLDEVGYRHIASWLYLYKHRNWGAPTRTDILITDRRLLCRLPHGQLSSLPWQGLIGLHIDLPSEHVVLDHADGHPVCFSGAASAVLAVAAVAFSYGLPALVNHSGLGPLRNGHGAGWGNPHLVGTTSTPGGRQDEAAHHG